MTVSIIIAAKTWQKNLEECVDKCQQLDYPDFEILIFPDEPIQNRDRSPTGAVPVSIFPTGPVCPADKRDMAIKYAKGEIIAFIDDDAYPSRDWLKNAVKNFQDENVAAVGGPAITPPEDSLRQKASGRVFGSLLVSARYTYRYAIRDKREVDDYPSCNLLVRKSLLEKLGGFNTEFWPGEDTKLCLDITKVMGKKIIYDPKVLAYHHRRPVFLPHLKQVASYALHRGFFVKRYPETSLRLAYFVPSLFLVALIGGGILSLYSFGFRIMYLAGILVYLFLAFVFSITKDLRLIPFVFLGIVLTHLTYGFYFLKGLAANKLKEES
jgi:GT2 family glycosyltransferase